MIETPLSSAKKGPKKVVLQVVRPTGIPPITLLFNPTEYQLQKSNNFAEIAIPGLETPPLQYVRGSAQKLTTELLLDTSDTLEDVRKRTEPLQKLMKINGELHAPPILRLVWDGEVFLGVVESLNITFVLFTPTGVPLRAKISLALIEYRTVEVAGGRDAAGLAGRGEEPRRAPRRFTGQRRQPGLQRPRAVARHRRQQRHPGSATPHARRRRCRSRRLR